MESLEHFELNEGYAAFRPEGLTTGPRTVALFRDAMEACQEHRVTRLLFDTRKLTRATALTAFDRFELGSSVAAFWNRKIRLVLLCRPDQIDPTSFGAAVAENRGLVVRAFANEKDALERLLAP